MDLHFSDADEAFRSEARHWLSDNLQGSFADVRGRGGPGDEHSLVEERKAWEGHMAAAGWTCLGWPKEHGGREASLMQQVIFYEEYARAKAPGRLGHMGEQLLGPTLIAYGSEAQQRRFLPPIQRGEELWCQGYSEPNAGSDLAALNTRAERDGDSWVIHGQKVWTSMAEYADWCFVLCRTNSEAPRHKGISYLLVPMKQPGIEIRPIRQMTGGAEFAEVFFDAARTATENLVGAEDEGWKIAMGTLAFERGASTLGQQLSFENELQQVTELARATGQTKDPVIRQRLAEAWMGLRIMRLNALRTLSGGQEGSLSRAGMINKLYWSTWHRALGELAMDVLGAHGDIVVDEKYTLTGLQRLFLFSRADTIYAGTNQIQRNIIGERALGLPREPRVANRPTSTKARS